MKRSTTQKCRELNRQRREHGHDASDAYRPRRIQQRRRPNRPWHRGAQSGYALRLGLVARTRRPRPTLHVCDALAVEACPPSSVDHIGRLVVNTLRTILTFLIVPALALVL